jgi:hypothetical protein
MDFPDPELAPPSGIFTVEADFLIIVDGWVRNLGVAAFTLVLVDLTLPPLALAADVDSGG